MKWLERESKHAKPDYQPYLSLCVNKRQARLLTNWLRYAIKPPAYNFISDEEYDDTIAVDDIIRKIMYVYVPISERKNLTYYLLLCKNNDEKEDVKQWLETSDINVFESTKPLGYDYVRVIAITGLLEEYYL